MVTRAMIGLAGRAQWTCSVAVFLPCALGSQAVQAPSTNFGETGWPSGWEA